MRRCCTAWAAAGLISEADLLSLRRLDSIYEGHPTPRIPWIDVATGSLGQGLPNAIRWRRFCGNDGDVVGSPARVWALLATEKWRKDRTGEAAPIAAELGLSNLTAIVDVNRLEQSVATRLGWDMDRYASQV
ncbi:MAG: hypothetical protein U0787_22060 [Polyangia bacterium]